MQHYELNHTETELQPKNNHQSIKDICQEMIYQFTETIKHNNKFNKIYTNDIKSRFHWITLNDFIMFGNTIEPHHSNKFTYHKEYHIMNISEFRDFNMNEDLYYTIDYIHYFKNDSLLYAKCLNKAKAIDYISSVIKKYIYNIDYSSYFNSAEINKYKELLDEIYKSLNHKIIAQLILEKGFTKKYTKFKDLMRLKDLSILEPNSNIKININLINLMDVNANFIHDTLMYSLHDILNKFNTSYILNKFNSSYNSIICNGFLIRQQMPPDIKDIDNFKYLNDNETKLCNELIAQTLDSFNNECTQVYNDHYFMLIHNDTKVNILENKSLKYSIININNFKNMEYGFFNTIYCIETPIKFKENYDINILEFFNKDEIINKINSAIIQLDLKEIINQQVSKYYCKIHENIAYSLSGAIIKTKHIIFEGNFAKIMIYYTSKERKKLQDLLNIDNTDILGNNLKISRKISVQQLCEPTFLQFNIHRVIEYLFTELIFNDKPYYPIEYQIENSLTCQSFDTFHSKTQELLTKYHLRNQNKSNFSFDTKKINEEFSKNQYQENNYS